MRVTIRGRVSRQDEELERRSASTQRNVYYLKIEQEEGEGHPQRDRIEIALGEIIYRIEFDPDGLIIGGYAPNGLSVEAISADRQAENVVLIRKA